MLARIDAARPEGHCEDGHKRGDGEGKPWRRRRRRQSSRFKGLGHQQHGLANGLQLQRNVRSRAHQSDERRDRGDGAGFAVARGDEIRDGRHILRLRQRRDATYESPPDADHQDRADVNRQKIETALRSDADGPIVGPRRAINREAERINPSAPTPRQSRGAELVARPSQRKQSKHVDDRGRDHPCAAQHASASSKLEIMRSPIIRRDQEAPSSARRRSSA